MLRPYTDHGPFGNVENPAGGTINTGADVQAGFTGAGGTPNGLGLVYLRNRWYDPQTGRFLTQDPIGLGGGINLYAYAGNAPTMFSDPFGLCTDKNGRNLPASQCRDETVTEGHAVLNVAMHEAWKWTEGIKSAGHCPKDPAHRIGDCTDAVESWQERAGLPAIRPTPRASVGSFGSSSDYRALGPDPVQVGDVAIYNHGAHAAIATGKTRTRGGAMQYQVWQNGVTHGTGYDWVTAGQGNFYRRQLPN